MIFLALLVLGLFVSCLAAIMIDVRERAEEVAAEELLDELWGGDE